MRLPAPAHRHQNYCQATLDTRPRVGRAEPEDCAQTHAAKAHNPPARQGVAEFAASRSGVDPPPYSSPTADGGPARDGHRAHPLQAGWQQWQNALLDALAAAPVPTVRRAATHAQLSRPVPAKQILLPA